MVLVTSCSTLKISKRYEATNIAPPTGPCLRLLNDNTTNFRFIFWWFGTFRFSKPAEYLFSNTVATLWKKEIASNMVFYLWNGKYVKSLAVTPKTGSFPNRHVEVYMVHGFLLVDKKSLEPITIRVPNELVLLLPWSTEIEKLGGNFLTKLQFLG